MSDKNQIDTEVLQHIRGLVEKSLEANTQVAQNGAELLKQLSQGDVDMSELTAKGNDVLNRALMEYVRLSSAHASQLIDLGVDVSRSILASVHPPAAGAVTPGTGTLFDLEVSGKPGELCQTAFYMESDRSESMSSAFSMTPVVDASQSEQGGFEITFEPKQVSMEPGTKERIVLRLKIPKSAEPGTYHSVISLDARPEKRFRLVVAVVRPEPGPEEESAEPPEGAAAREASKSKPKTKGASGKDKTSTKVGATTKKPGEKSSAKPAGTRGKKPSRSSGDKPPKKPGR